MYKLLPANTSQNYTNEKIDKHLIRLKDLGNGPIGWYTLCTDLIR